MVNVIRLTTLLDFGGQEKQYDSFTQHPEKLSLNYHFGALGYGGRTEKKIRERGFDVSVFNKDYSIKNLHNIYLLYKWFKKTNPNIVHTAAGEANFHGVIAAKLAGVPIIIAEEIGLPSHSKLASRIFKAIYTMTDCVICVSEAVKENLIEIGEIKANKAKVIYNPVSFHDAKPSNKKKKAFKWMYVGRLKRVKNVELLIRAFSKVRREGDNQLNIIGDGEEREKLERLALELRLNDSVNFHGYQANPETFLANADAFVLPSLREGFGIAVVEAMYQGVPSICSNVGGIPEFIEHGQNGWLFNSNSVADLVKCMKTVRALSDDNRQQIIKCAKKTAERFSVSNYINNIENLYKKLLYEKR